MATYDHNIQTVDTVADLVDLLPVNAQQVQTLGYRVAGDGGGNLYRYVDGDANICDGGFILDGPGGNNTPAETNITYPGTSAQGRYYAVDQTWINAKQYGCNGDGFTDDTARINAIVRSLNIAGGYEAFFNNESYAYTSLDTITNTTSMVRGPGVPRDLVGGAPRNLRGTGGPNGIVTAPVGSTYQDVAGGTLYLKESGTGNSGWNVNAGTAQSVVDSVADLASITGLEDGTIILTRGYYTPRDGGGNTYEYQSGDASTIDGGFVIDGPGSIGRYLALDQTVANVKQFGAVGDGVANDTAALQNAHDSIYADGDFPIGGKVVIPEGTYVFDSNFRIERGVHVEGLGGYSSTLIGVGAGVVLDNTGDKQNNFSRIQNLRIITAEGTTVPAVKIQGSAADGVARWSLSNVQINRTGTLEGVGLSIEGAWIITLDHVILGGFETGLLVQQAGGVDSSANAFNMFGGAIAGNTNAANIDFAANFNFYGVDIEGNINSGLTITEARGGTIDGCHFEANGPNYDISIGESGGVLYGHTITGCYFNTPETGGLAHSIRVGTPCRGVLIQGCYFKRYTAEPILITGPGAQGEARLCTKDSDNTIGMVDVATNGADRFLYHDCDVDQFESELTIAGGAIDIRTGYHKVDTEANAATDDLDTINGGTRGMVLQLRLASGSRHVTITGGGNIALSSPIALTEAGDLAILYYNETRNEWTDTATSVGIGLIAQEGAATTVIATNSTDWTNKVQVLSFAADGASNATITPDHTNDHITVNKDGVYRLMLTGIAAGGNNAEYRFGIFVNNGATEVPLSHARLIMNGNGDTGPIILQGYYTATAGDTFEVWVERQAGTGDVAIDNLYLSVEQR